MHKYASVTKLTCQQQLVVDRQIVTTRTTRQITGGIHWLQAVASQTHTVQISTIAHACNKQHQNCSWDDCSGRQVHVQNSHMCVIFTLTEQNVRPQSESLLSDWRADSMIQCSPLAARSECRTRHHQGCLMPNGFNQLRYIFWMRH